MVGECVSFNFNGILVGLEMGLMDGVIVGSNVIILSTITLKYPLF